MNRATNIDDIVEIEVTPKTLAALPHRTQNRLLFSVSAKQSAEWCLKNIITVKRHCYRRYSAYENRNVYIDLGKAEAVLTVGEQIPGEIYEYHDRMKPIF